jgi:hypothetical protein
MTEEELQAKIDDAVSGLKAKNAELLAKLDKAKKGQEIDPEDFKALEAANDKLKDDLNAANKATKESLKANESLQNQIKTETGFTQKLLVDNGLSDALLASGVVKDALPALKALFASQASVVIDGDTRSAKIGDKSLTDFIGEWSKTDAAKFYISAPANGGGGAQGGRGGQSGQKTMTRAQFETTDQTARSEFAKAGGTITD